MEHISSKCRQCGIFVCREGSNPPYELKDLKTVEIVLKEIDGMYVAECQMCGLTSRPMPTKVDALSDIAGTRIFIVT